MTKKKLAFYDSFKQKPDESAEQSVDSISTSDTSSSSRNLSGYSNYNPGDDLTIRPANKQIPTAHHHVSGRNVEVRAKGSSLAPGAAQKYQTPNVNRGYLPTDTEVFRTIPTIGKIEKPKNNPPMPPLQPSTDIAYTSQEESAVTSRIPPIPKAPSFIQNEIEAKEVSDQSTTLPYLEPGDLETQKVPTPNVQKSVPKPTASYQKTTSSSNQVKKTSEHLISVTVPQALFGIMVILIIVVLSYVMGNSFQKENSSNVIGIKPDKDVAVKQNREVLEVTESKKVSLPIEVPKQEIKEEKTVVAIDKPQKTYTIHALTVANQQQAIALKQKLEANKYGPILFQNNRDKSVTIKIGPFKSSVEANNMLKKLKLLAMKGGSRPFEKAEIK